SADAVVDLDAIRPDLREVLDRQARARDAARPDAVERRRKTKQRTARENVEDLDDPAARYAVMAYDYTVFAGTQGGRNHQKTDRLIDVAIHGRMPMVLFAEGGGGRPGDDNSGGGSGQRTFSRFAQLSGLVPMVGITSGRCFAGNASLLGCCDVIIA